MARIRQLTTELQLANQALVHEWATHLRSKGCPEAKFEKLLDQHGITEYTFHAPYDRCLRALEDWVYQILPTGDHTFNISGWHAEGPAIIRSKAYTALVEDVLLVFTVYSNNIWPLSPTLLVE